LKSGASAAANPGALKWVKKVHSHARELKGDLSPMCVWAMRLFTCMLNVAVSIDDAILVFDRMEISMLEHLP